MAVPHQEFKKAGADIGAGITEQFLNRFGIAHFKTIPAVYSGQEVFNDFDVKLSVTYKVTAPLQFDLAPISKARFKKILHAHFVAKGSSIKSADEVHLAPANVQLTTKKMEFVVTVHKKDGSVDFSVPFVWDLKALCAVVLTDAGSNKKALRLIPIKVEFSQPNSLILSDIRTAIRRVRVPTKNHESALAGPGDTEWCIKLERLFLFIINQVLGKQLANFITALELPRAIELVSGLSIQPFMLEVVDNALLVGGRVLPTKAVNNRLSNRIDVLMQEFSRRYDEEVSDIAVLDDKSWKIGNSPTFKWLEEQVKEAEAEARAHRDRPIPTKPRVPENLYLLSNDTLFDQLAKLHLNYYQGEEFSTPEILAFRAVAGYWLKIDGASANVVQKGIAVRANFGAHGHAGVQVRNFWDLKNLGRWEDLIDLCIDLKADPRFEISAYPIFKTNGIYLHLLLNKPDRIEAKWCGGVPGEIPGRLLAFILTTMSALILSLLKVLIASFVVKIADYPSNFPGTAIPWSPNMNTTPSNNGPYLTFSGDPTFK